MFRIAPLVLLVIVLAAAPATAPTDRSTVKGAVSALWHAIATGDVLQVGDSLDTSDDRLTGAAAELLVAGKKLSDTASARFGKSGHPIGRTMLDFGDPDQALSKLQITETGDTATVTGENQTKMQFRRTNGQWRLVVPEFTGGKREDLPQQVKLLHDMAVALNEAAREIQSGKYDTAPEAERLIQDRLHAVMIETFRPATRPSPAPAASRP